MDLGHFYFLTDQYYIDFPDNYLMKNHEVINGVNHDRPCFYAMSDSISGIYWLIPFSSQIGKFKNIYNIKVAKYGNCDTIDFAYVLGHEKAFLIQNMCPVTSKYIKNEYLSNSTPVSISYNDSKRIISKAKKVLALQKEGIKLIFPDVLSIENKLVIEKQNFQIT